MNKAVLVLTLLCGFLLGVVAGPWLRPRDLPQVPHAEPTAAPPLALAVPETPPPPPPEPPPPAEPELALKGVFVGADAGRSRALIAHGEDAPRLYKVDDKLPDGAVLKTVTGKDIEVEKNGEMRTLALERGKPGVEANEIALPTEAAESQPSPATETVEPVETQAPVPVSTIVESPQPP